MAVPRLVHYFDRTGISRIDLKDIKEHFLDWTDTVRAAVAYAAKQPHVDPKRIGLLGFSLGAYLSLAVAARDDLRIAAVADWFGGFPKELRKDVKHLPPTLIVHGDADKTVPVEEALALERLLKGKSLKYELKIYKNQDHLFLKNLLSPDITDAKRLTLAFFDKHLKNDPERLSAGDRRPLATKK